MTGKIDTSPEAVAVIMARERHRPFPYSLDGLETATMIEALSAERDRLATAHAQMQQTIDRVTAERDAMRDAAVSLADSFESYENTAVDHMTHQEACYAAVFKVRALSPDTPEIRHDGQSATGRTPAT